MNIPISNCQKPAETRPVLDQFQDSSKTGSGKCFKKFFSD